MVCDGAKASCAAKIGLAVENALMALELSLAGNVFQPGEGMTMEDPEDTIAAVGRMGRSGYEEHRRRDPEHHAGELKLSPDDTRPDGSILSGRGLFSPLSPTPTLAGLFPTA